MFLSNLPDDIPLSSLVLPGSMAFYGWPVSQCQSTLTPLMAQLHSGIRVLDVRLAIVHNRLISYHGAYPQREPFQIILATLFAFLSDPATCMETIVVSIKQEDFKKHHPHRFSLLVRDEIENGPGGLGMWFLENRIPVLGEVRGKAIMFSRFGDGCGWQGGLQGLGIHPPRWPDSCKAGFIWQCRDTLVRTHDWYNISSFLLIPEKVRLATQNILFQQQPRSPETPATPPILSITYFSAASFPFALPTVVACGFGWPRWGLGIEGVNSRVGKWLLGQLSIGGAASGAKTDHSENQSEELKAPDDHPDIRGWMFLDFYSQPEDGILVPLLIECNFV
ncbi:hypothetical protein AMATHDRAFT_74266 [Amanita thiersii Skay4041]|uniref:Phosphatidylinositol-specific phospholipase C X domain-containing protein n=1 Tax=Amanita thiersii Skay4041 TaxID=703135 RepID=A0A2A9NVY5_9AGAR|nr:hypothetical protein AMATHDRAFT_74266 [Amanita thiersii Skay4041]